MFNQDQDNNVIIDNIDDIENDITWLKDDVKQYASNTTNSYNNSNHINDRRSTHRRTVIHQVSDNELKNYMETSYRNFTITKKIIGIIIIIIIILIAMMMMMIVIIIIIIINRKETYES